MEIQNPKRSKSLMYFHGVAKPESSSRPTKNLMNDTILHIGKYHFPRFEEIYRIFDSTNFPEDDKVLEMY